MSLDIDVSEGAIADALAIAEYLAAQAGFNTSDRFLNATTQTYRRLADMPGIGVERTYKNLRLAGMRMFPLVGFAQYLVFYRVTATQLRIERIINGSQNIEMIFNPSDED